jgi:hypothetical protein
MMAAPEGNQFWKQRSRHGPKPVFASPDDLWEACCEYFEWVEANPLLEERIFNGKDGIAKTDARKMRAMTVAGLCIFLDISEDTWRAYEAREGFEEVTDQVRRIIRTQKFEGAAADLLNPNIIARELGLAERSEIKTETALVEVSNSERARAVFFVLTKNWTAQERNLLNKLLQVVADRQRREADNTTPQFIERNEHAQA